MGKSLFRNCAFVFSVLFFGFMGLYIYLWLEDPNPQVSESGTHWSYFSLGHHAQPLTGTNNPETGTYFYDGGDSFHFTVTKNWGGNLLFFNQNMPSIGSIVGFAGDDRTSETGWSGWGISFRHITHTVEKNKNWWTLMISLWYPIIFTGILPAVFLVKKVRGHAART
jgi:hypothetical protein